MAEGRRPDLRDFTQPLPMALLKARESVMDYFRPLLREHNVSEQQWRVIRALRDREGIEAPELARTCMILTPSLTRIIKTLEQRRLVERFAVEGDQRRRSIALTDAGHKLFETISPRSDAQYKKLTRKWGRAETDELCRLLTLLDERL